MTQNFHEHLERPEVKPPSERATGLVFAAVAAIVAYLNRDSQAVLWAAGGASMALALLSLAAPRLLKPLNIVWFRFGLLLHRIVNPLVMAILFYGIVTPAGFLMRRVRDPLNARGRGDNGSFWLARHEPPGSMKNQF